MNAARHARRDEQPAPPGMLAAQNSALRQENARLRDDLAAMCQRVAERDEALDRLARELFTERQRRTQL